MPALSRECARSPDGLLHSFFIFLCHNSYLVHAILGIGASPFFLAGWQTPRIAWTKKVILTPNHEEKMKSDRSDGRASGE